MSIVLELQKDACNPNTPLTALLRKCLVVASKLGLPDSMRWVEQELNGYKPEILATPLPSYRDVPTQIVGYNVYHGWRPVQFENPAEADQFASVRIYSPVAELERMVERSGSGTLQMTLPPVVSAALVKATHSRTEFRREISQTSVVGVLDAVRNLVLQWSLKLERAGVLGEAHTFTQVEQQKAANIQVPDIAISGSHNSIAILQGTTSSSLQTVTATTSRAGSELKPKGSWLSQLGLRVVKVIPEKWIVAGLTILVGIGGGAYAWIKGWFHGLLK